MELFQQTQKLKFKVFKQSLSSEHFTFFKKDPTPIEKFKNFIFPEKTYKELFSKKAGLLLIHFLVISFVAFLSKHTEINNLNDHLTVLMLACTMPIFIRLFRYIVVIPLATKLNITEREVNYKFLAYPLIADIFVAILSVAYMLYFFK